MVSLGPICKIGPGNELRFSNSTNSSSLSTGNQDCDGVWISDVEVHLHRFLRCYFPFSS